MQRNPSAHEENTPVITVDKQELDLHIHTHTLTVEFIDLRQVGEDAGQLIRVQHRPHLLEKYLIQDP